MVADIESGLGRNRRAPPGRQQARSEGLFMAPGAAHLVTPSTSLSGVRTSAAIPGRIATLVGTAPS